ncbi:MAG TPA: multidrug resistance efflux transporter family protein [Rectinemataceae bacterium]|nr:multidrug resistance efflux transporter family protein [Rectinemataceae bacterium]
MKAVLLGLLASFFFAFTFVLNRQMDLAGGSWIWSASLRYLFMLPMLGLLLAPRGELRAVLRDLKQRPLPWLLWSTVGFGFFYAPLTLAAAYGPSWLVAASWQLTIVAGALLSPLFRVEGGGGDEGRGQRERHRIPRRVLLFSALILLGVALLQIPEAGRGGGGLFRAVAASGAPSLGGPLFAVFILIAAFAYPLGNRKVMRLCSGRLTTLQRVFGMTLASMPFWIVLSVAGLLTVGAPPPAQLLQTFAVALSSGLVATLLFFGATDLVHGDMHRLAAVESTQAGEVVFTLLGGVLVFGDHVPGALGFLGLALVVGGMTLNSFLHGVKA